MEAPVKSFIDTKKKMGDRFIEGGYITPQQLEIALKEKKRRNDPLGQILIQLGFLSENDLYEALSDDLGVPFVKLSSFSLDSALIQSFSETYLRENLFIPIETEEDGMITVAMADPANIILIDQIQDTLGCNITIFAATQADIVKAIGETFKSKDAESGSPDEIEDEEIDIQSATETVDDIIDMALMRQATDIHIEPEEKVLRIRYRMDGILQQGDTLPREMIAPVLARFKIISNMDITERRKPQDGRFSKKKGSFNVDFRVSSMPTAHGENIVIRLLDRSSVNLHLKSLGIDSATYARLDGIANMSHGLFLVSGPTGSGKTTTLYSMILLVDALSKKVVTVEDPIEYSLPLIRQSQVDSEIGYTFADGLRTILRQDPDVILVGEIRDPETAGIAIKSSMTGHMVFSSIHTNNAMAAVQRLMDLGIPHYLITTSMTGVLGQRLVRAICPKCRVPIKPTEAEVRWLGVENPDVEIFKGRGCAACHNTGFAGRTVIYELFVLDEEFADLVAGKASDKDFIKVAKKKGMDFTVDTGKKKVLSGDTTISEVLRVCNDVII